MILQGIDQLRVIGVEEMGRLLRIVNVGFMAFYFNSPCQRLTKWTPEALAALTDLGLMALPIYVGSQTPFYQCATDLSTDMAGEHARDAARLMVEWGYLPERQIPCVLDIEAETYAWRPVETADYGAAWAAELDRLGYLPTIYGDADTLRAVGAQLSIDWQAWLARWVRKELDPTVTTRQLFADAGLSAAAGRRIVQYASQNHYPPMGGLGYDWNAADAEFAPAM